jgi:hypothetical protein
MGYSSKGIKPNDIGTSLDLTEIGDASSSLFL